MDTLLSVMFPIQFDSLRWRWVFLSLLVIWLWIVYNFIQYFFRDDNVELKEVSTEELISEVAAAEKKQLLDKQLKQVETQWWISFFQKMILFLKPKTKIRVEDVFNWEWYDEEIESQVIEDGFDISIDDNAFEDSDNQQLDSSTSINEEWQDDILMTESKAKEIDNITRSSIHWEEFDNEIQYLRKKQKWLELEKKLIEWLAKDSEHPLIIEQLSQYYIEQNQPKKSLPLLKRLLDQNPDNHKVLRQMADIYLTLEDIETSEVLINRALTLNPKNPKYAITLVEIYYNTKRKDDAINLMEDVVKRRPANLWYRDTLAKLYEEMHDYDLAVECYQSMLTIDPKNNTIKRKLLETRTKIVD